MLDEIIKSLDGDATTKEFIEGMIQENYDCGGNLYMTDDIMTFLRGYAGVTDSSDLNVLLNIMINNINDKTAERMRLNEEAQARAGEYSSYYNDSYNSAAEHLFSNYLGESPEYNKTLSDSYREYLEEKEKQK